MVNVKSESVKMEVANLPEFLQKEWQCVVRYHSEKSDTVLFEEFKKRYDNFEGPTIEEFLSIPKVVYTEWENWKYRNSYETDFKVYNRSTETQVKTKTLTEVFCEFKEFCQYNSEESKVMFKEMELLSENMLSEWRLKYNFTYTHVYEGYDSKYEVYSKKSKAELWEEFKEIWEIDIDDYNENKYNEMIKYISEVECDDSNYFKKYPQNFFEYRENANYHSFDSYSVLEQFEICEDWERYQEQADIEETDSENSDSENSDSEDENSEDETCPGCYKTRSYAWNNNKCNSCGYDEEEENERASGN
jgi:hypothetical protein